MKKASKIIFIISLISIIILTSSCQKNRTIEGTIKRGSWNKDESVFTNTWSGIKINLLDNQKRAEEYLRSKNEEASGFLTQTQKTNAIYDINLYKTVHDLEINSNNSTWTFRLFYENIAINPDLVNLTPEEYLENIYQKVSVDELIGAEKLGERIEKTISGKTWIHDKYTINNINYQEYYVRKQDGIIICIQISYYLGNESAANAFLDTLTTP